MLQNPVVKQMFRCVVYLYFCWISSTIFSRFFLWREDGVTKASINRNLHEHNLAKGLAVLPIFKD